MPVRENHLALLKGEGTARTDTNALPTFLAPGGTDWLVTKSGNHSLEATMGKADDAYAQMLPAYPHTSSTENTFIRVINEQGVAIIYGELAPNLPETL